MAKQRGLVYTVETRANLGGLDSFTKKIEKVKKAWEELKTSTGTLKLGASKKNLTDIGNTAPKLKLVAKYLRSINRSLASINNKSGGTVRLMREMDRSNKRSAASMKKVSGAATKTKKELSGAAAQAAAMSSKLKRAAAISVRILAIYAGFQAIKGVLGAIKGAVTQAFLFTDSMQKAELGIRALLFSMLDVRDAQGNILKGQEAFAATTQKAREQVAALRVEGLRTSATFQELVETFQTALGPGLAAGLNLEQIRRITVLVSQAAQSIGLPQQQLSEEIRSLITGTGSERTTRLAKQILKISSVDINKAREAGQLFDFLEKKLEGFGQASEGTLNLLSTQLINLGDIAKQSLGEALLGSFGKLKDSVKSLNAFFGQGKDGIISLNPKVLSLFSKLDAILTSILDKGIAFAKGFDFTTAEQTIDRLTTVGSALFSVFSFAFGVLQNVAKFLGIIVITLAEVDSAFRKIPGVGKVWNLGLRITSGLLTIIVARALYLNILAGATRVILFSWNSLLAIFRGIALQVEAAMLLINVEAGGLAPLLVSASAAAGTLLAVLARLLLPVTLVVGALGLLLTFFDDELAPKMKEALKGIWQSILLSLQVSLAEMEASFKGAAVRIKDFFGLDITNDAAAKISELNNQLSEASRKLAESTIHKDRGGIAFGESRVADLKNRIDELKGLAATVTLEDALAKIQADSEAKIHKIVSSFDKAGTGKQSFFDALNILKTKLASLVGLAGDASGDAGVDQDLASFTNKFNEARLAYSTLIDTAKKADQKLALAQASAGLTDISLAATKLGGDLDVSIKKVNNLGLQLAVTLAQRIKNLQKIEILDPKQEAELAGLKAALDDVKDKLLGIQEIRDSTLGTQIAAQAQIDRNARILRNRATALEIGQLRDIANVRSLLIDRKITREAASAQIQLIQAKQAFEITTARIKKEIEFLDLQAKNENILAEDRQVFFEASLTATAELFKETEKYKLSLIEINRVLENQKLLQDNPAEFGAKQFLAGLQSKKEVIAQGTQDLMQAFSDGVVATVSDTFVDALFSQENSIRDRWEALMKDLSKILIEALVKAQLADMFANLATGGTSSGKKKANIFNTGGKVASQQGAASMAHFSSSAKFFAKGGRPSGIPASDTVAAWLTPGEWVTKRSSVQKYGDQVMAMLNSGAIDPVALRALAASARGSSGVRRRAASIATRGYASGGSVAAQVGAGGSGGTTIVNTFDDTSLAAALGTKVGERMVVNHVLASGILKLR